MRRTATTFALAIGLATVTACGTAQAPEQAADSTPAAPTTQAPAQTSTPGPAAVTTEPEQESEEPTTEQAEETTSNPNQSAEPTTGTAEAPAAGAASFLGDQAWQADGQVIGVYGDVAVLGRTLGEPAQLRGLDEAGDTVWDVTPSSAPLDEAELAGTVTMDGLSSIIVLWSGTDDEQGPVHVVAVIDPATGEEIGRDVLAVDELDPEVERISLNEFWHEGNQVLTIDEAAGTMSVEPMPNGSPDGIRVSSEVTAPIDDSCPALGGPGWVFASRLSPDRQQVIVPGGVADLGTGEVACAGTFEEDTLSPVAVGDDGTVVGLLFPEPGADATGTYVSRDLALEADRESEWLQFAGILGDLVLVVEEDGEGVAAYPLR